MNEWYAKGTDLAGFILGLTVYLAAGIWFLKAVKIKVSPIMKYPYAFATASVIFGTFIFIAGVIPGAYNIFSAIVFMAAGAYLFFKEITEIVFEIKAYIIKKFQEKLSPLSISLKSLLFLFFGYVLCAILLPPVYYDSLVYHLAVPQGWIRAGGIVNMPDNIFSYFPALLSADYVPFLLLGGHTAVKLYQAMFGIMLLFTVAALTTELKGNVKHALLLIFTFPLFFLNLSRVTAEMPLAFFELTAIFILIKAGKENSQMDFKTVFVLALMLTGANGAKYTGVIVYSTALIYMLYLCIRGKMKLSMLLFPILLPIGMFIPFAVRNFLWTGNPVYPFFSGCFASVSDMANAAGNYVSHVKGFGLEHNIKNFLLSPFYLIFKSELFGGDVLSPAIIVAPLLLLVTGIGGLGGIIFFSGSMFTVWFFTGEVLRFLLTPCVLALVLIAVFTEKNKNIWSTVLLTTLIIFQMGTGVYFGEKYLQPLTIFTKNTNQYLTEKISYYKATQFIDKIALPKNGKVLFIGEGRTYYCDHRTIAGTVFNDSGFAKNLKEKIRDTDLTLVNFTELTRLKTGGYAEVYRFIFSKEFKDFMEKEARMIYNDENCIIWKSKDNN